MAINHSGGNLIEPLLDPRDEARNRDEGPGGYETTIIEPYTSVTVGGCCVARKKAKKRKSTPPPVVLCPMCDRPPSLRSALRIDSGYSEGGKRRQFEDPNPKTPTSAPTSKSGLVGVVDLLDPVSCQHSWTAQPDYQEKKRRREMRRQEKTKRRTGRNHRHSSDSGESSSESSSSSSSSCSSSDWGDTLDDHALDDHFASDFTEWVKSAFSRFSFGVLFSAECWASTVRQLRRNRWLAPLVSADGEGQQTNNEPMFSEVLVKTKKLPKETWRGENFVSPATDDSPQSDGDIDMATTDGTTHEGSNFSTPRQKKVVISINLDDNTSSEEVAPYSCQRSRRSPGNGSMSMVVSNRSRNGSALASLSFRNPHALLGPMVDTRRPPVTSPGGSHPASMLLHSNRSSREASRYLIPPPTPEHEGKLTVVLDLDETLVYCRDGPALQRRPYLDELMQFLASAPVEVVVWTAGVRGYAKKIISDIDPTGTIIHHCVYRHTRWYGRDEGEGQTPTPNQERMNITTTDSSDNNHGVTKDQRAKSEQREQQGWGVYDKDLTRLGRPLKSTIILDNTAAVCLPNPGNALVCPDFRGHHNQQNGEGFEDDDLIQGDDRTLLVLKQLLQELLQSSTERNQTYGREIYLGVPVPDFISSHHGIIHWDTPYEETLLITPTEEGTGEGADRQNGAQTVQSLGCVRMHYIWLDYPVTSTSPGVSLAPSSFTDEGGKGGEIDPISISSAAPADGGKSSPKKILSSLRTLSKDDKLLKQKISGKKRGTSKTNAF